MSASTTPLPEHLHQALRKELSRLAQHEEDVAASEAAHVHYWETMPVTVSIHRQCAAALRAAAEDLRAQHRARPHMMLGPRAGDKVPRIPVARCGLQSGGPP